MVAQKNINDALLPITVISWLMGMGTFESPLGKPQIKLSIIYSIICIVLLSTSISMHVLRYFSIYISRRTSSYWFAIFFFSGSLFLCITAMISSKAHTLKLKLCLQELDIIDKQMNRIGIFENYEKRYWMSIFIVAIIIVYLTFVMGLMLIYNVNNCNLETVLIPGGTLYFAVGMPYLIKCKFIYIIRQMYLDLVRISRTINDIFSAEILVLIIFSIILIISFITTLFYAYIIKHPKGYTFILAVPGSIYFITKLVAINYMCHTTCEETLMTETILLELQETTDAEFFKEINQFSFEVAHNHLIFTANGFFELDHKYIIKVAGMLTTYIIMMTQFEIDSAEDEDKQKSS